MDVSIIIPVHNAGKYLRRCVGSVLEALDGLVGEVLLVNDNSTDNSGAIMRHYQRKWQKIVRVLQCHTPGAAAARNTGAETAQGKYIWFVDADDYVANESLIKLVGRAKATDADLVMMGAERVKDGEATSYLSAVKVGDKSRFVRYGMGPWQVLIKRQWWIEHGFRFCEGMIHEDMELMSALILYTDKFESIDEPFYYYCNNPESVLHKSEFSPHIFDIFPALEGLYGRFEKAGAVSRYRDELEWFFIWNLLIDSAKDFGKFPEGRPGFKRARQMLRQYFPGWRRNRFLKQKPAKLRTKVRLNYYKR